MNSRYNEIHNPVQKKSRISNACTCSMYMYVSEADDEGKTVNLCDDLLNICTCTIILYTKNLKKQKQTTIILLVYYSFLCQFSLS